MIREAILNAVSHRDYRHAGSVFIKQYPTKIELVSPGGFPSGITPENIFWKQHPRNRRIAEVFARCGMVERSGQGSQFRDLNEVLPSLSRDQVKKILAEMKREKMICLVGKTSAARWYPGTGD